MNRVLCWPHTSIVPGLLDDLKIGRSRTVVTDKGAIRFQQALGPVAAREGYSVAPGATSLEDVFIQFMAGAKDNMQ